MSNMIYERPGVYSSYDASAVVSAGQAPKAIGVAALAEKGTVGTAVTLTSYTAGVEAFGEDGDTPGMSTILRLLFANGASTVTAVRVAESAGTTDYTAAFAAMKWPNSCTITRKPNARMAKITVSTVKKTPLISRENRQFRAPRGRFPARRPP